MKLKYENLSTHKKRKLKCFPKTEKEKDFFSKKKNTLFEKKLYEKKL